jgi:hypothetical protein
MLSFLESVRGRKLTLVSRPLERLGGALDAVRKPTFALDRQPGLQCSSGHFTIPSDAGAAPTTASKKRKNMC